MQMTDDEIRSSMRRAKHPAEQVKVLAELNACSEAEVRAKLEELGIAVPAKKPKVWKFDTDRARQLLAEGRTDLEAAEMLGISKQTFGDWRRSMKLPVNPEPRRQAKAKRAMPGPAPAVPPIRETRAMTAAHGGDLCDTGPLVSRRYRVLWRAGYPVCGAGMHLRGHRGAGAPGAD